MPETPRRAFLGRLASSTLALAGAAALDPGALLAEAAEAEAAARDLAFDDGWTARVRAAKHRAVFDGPEVNDGLALFQPWIWRSGYRAALGVKPEDAVPVVVLRHAGTALAIDDALWAKYGIGAARKIDDPATKKPAERNPFARRRPEDKDDDGITAMLGGPIDPTVEGLVRSGAVVLCCNLALTNFAGVLARKTDGDRARIAEELRAGLVPGVLLQPSGVYATARAQEVGCVFMRSA